MSKKTEFKIAVLIAVFFAAIVVFFVPNPVKQKPIAAIRSAGQSAWIQNVLETRYRVKRPYSSMITTMIEQASVEYNVSPMIVMSIIKVESDYISRNGKHGEIGFMQLKPKFWKKPCNKYDVHDKYENILVGACALRYNMDLTDNISDALTAYNIGFTNFDKDVNLLNGFAYRDKVLDENMDLVDLSLLPIDTN